jgi:hypothetical protein
MPSAASTPTEATIQEALGGFLKFILPPDTEVVEGQDTAVSEPYGSRFVVVTPMSRPRLATNLVLYAETQIYASISGSKLNVDSIQFGTIIPNSLLWGIFGDVQQGTTIIKQIGGMGGGPGVYELSHLQTTVKQTMACGNMYIWTDNELVFQLDIHGANPRESTDMVSTISALFRDEVATDYFDNLRIGLSPLHADEPHQVPFLNAEQAWETRWSLDAHMQVSQKITLPQQFTTSVIVQIQPLIS